MKSVIVIPTYNEESNIGFLLEKIFKNLNDVQVIIVDDSAEQKIKRITKHFQNIIYIHRGEKKGRGSAVLKGMNYALKKKIDFMHLIEMDADMSHNPNEIKDNMNFCLEKKIDLLISSRYLKESKILNWPIKRKLLSYLSNTLAKLFLKVPVTDFTNGFRIYSRKAVEHVVKNCGNVGDGFIILSEILVQLYYNNYKVLEKPTIFVNRIRGISNVNFKELKSSLIGLLKVYFIKSQLTKSN